MNEICKARLGLLPVLAERAPTGHIGRTALMKYMYFLQTLRNIRLGYDFSMYSYGPFDSNVLADLSSAEALGIVNVTPVQFSGGYGYRIAPGNRAESAKAEVCQFLRTHDGDISWLFRVFGSLNSAELELASTIVFVDRELSGTDDNKRLPELVDRVGEIKPHFARQQIQKFAQDLVRQGVLHTTVAGA
jgi:uncharacterized protein